MTINHESFSPEFAAWINSAPLDHIYGEYSDGYKDCHGIRPRWVHNYTREEFANAFVSLGMDFESQRKWEAEDRAYDAWVIESKLEVPIFAEPEPLPYEEYDVA